MRKLTDLEINKIETFLKKKEVIYYDLKMELLDHLCNSIEDEWEKNPEIKFNDALLKVYKTFGIFGFATIIEKREESLGRYYRKSILKHVLTWCKLPQIVLTLILGYSLFLLLGINNYFPVKEIILATGLVIATIRSVQMEIEKRKKIKLSQPIFVMDKVITEAGGFFHILNMLNIFFILSSNLPPVIDQWIWTIIGLFYCLFIYHLFFDFPKNRQKYFKFKYLFST